MASRPSTPLRINGSKWPNEIRGSALSRMSRHSTDSTTSGPMRTTSGISRLDSGMGYRTSGAGHAEALSAHGSHLNVFLADWTAKQELLLRSLASCDLETLQGRTTSSSDLDKGAHHHKNENKQSQASKESRLQFSGTVSEHVVVTADDERSLNIRKTTNSVWSRKGGKNARTTVLNLMEGREQQLSTMEMCTSGQWIRALMFAVTQLTLGVIVANTVTIAVQADYAIDHPGKENPTLETFELAFSCYYVVEIALKVGLRPRDFMFGEEWRWNLFDCGLALQALFEQTWRLAGNGSHQNMSFLRMLRLLKVLKLMRLIRLLRAFRELRLMLTSLFGCLRALAWVSLLVIVTTFTFAISIMQATAQYFDEDPSRMHDPSVRSGIDQYWNSVAQSMMTLFMATMNGQDWELLAMPLKPIGWHAYAMLVLYVFFCAFTVVNIMNAVFIEAMMDYSHMDNKLQLEMEMEKREDYVEKLRSLYDAMDLDLDGVVTLEEFQNRCQHEEMVAFLATLQIDATDASHFFKVLSQDGVLAVDADTFVTGCMKLKGNAKAVDVLELASRHQHAVHKQDHFIKETRLHFAKLEETFRLLFEEATSVDCPAEAETSGKDPPPKLSDPPAKSVPQAVFSERQVSEPLSLSNTCERQVSEPLSMSLPETVDESGPAKVSLRDVAAPVAGQKDSRLDRSQHCSDEAVRPRNSETNSDSRLVRPNFCGRCGGAVLPNYRFCRLCGTPVAMVPLETFEACRREGTLG